MVTQWIGIIYFVGIGIWFAFVFLDAFTPMSSLLHWLNQNPGLAGWAQAGAAVIAVGAGSVGIAW